MENVQTDVRVQRVTLGKGTEVRKASQLSKAP